MELPGWSILDHIERLGNMIASAPRMRGTSRCLVNIEKLNETMAAIKASLPSEMEDAQSIVRQKESVIKQAELEARRIRAYADAEAKTIREIAEKRTRAATEAAERQNRHMIEETDVYGLARERAVQIQEEAYTAAGTIIENAEIQARTIIAAAHEQIKEEPERKVAKVKLAFYAFAAIISICFVVLLILVSFGQRGGTVLAFIPVSILFLGVATYWAWSMYYVQAFEWRVAYAFGMHWANLRQGFHFCPRGFVRTPWEWRVTTQHLVIEEIYPGDLPVEIENALVGISASLTYKVVDPWKWLFVMRDGGAAVAERIPERIRDVVQTLLSKKELAWVRGVDGAELTKEIRALADSEFAEWGVEIVSFTIGDISEPPEIQSAREERYRMDQLFQAAWEDAKQMLGITDSDEDLTETDRSSIRAELPAAQRRVLKLQAMASLSKMRMVGRPSDLMNLAGIDPAPTNGTQDVAGEGAQAK